MRRTLFALAGTSLVVLSMLAGTLFVRDIIPAVQAMSPGDMVMMTHSRHGHPDESGRLDCQDSSAMHQSMERHCAMGDGMPHEHSGDMPHRGSHHMMFDSTWRHNHHATNYVERHCTFYPGDTD